MHRFAGATMIALIGFFLIGLAPALAQQDGPVLDLSQAPGPDFVKLFNGRDMSGWMTGPAWSVENGVMVCKGHPRDPYLTRTEKEYENFDFYAEFKITPGCNSGIFFHAPIPGAGRESKLSFEVQIIDDYGKPPNSTSTGSIYSVVAPKVNAIKPAGEWNQYRVLFDWPNCKVWLNGKLIQDVDFASHRELRFRLRSGFIGLSNHGHKVYYRNLWIKELPGKEKWIELFDGSDLTRWEKIGDADWHVEDGMIVVTRGEGFLVTKEAFQDFQFHAYVLNDEKQSRDGGFFLRWIGEGDPGYFVDFYDMARALDVRKRLGEGPLKWRVGPVWGYQWIPYQLISTERNLFARVCGTMAYENLLANKLRKGRIAIYHAPRDGVMKIKRVRIKSLDN